MYITIDNLKENFGVTRELSLSSIELEIVYYIVFTIQL